jgi:hypothetical protein
VILGTAGDAVKLNTAGDAMKEVSWLSNGRPAQFLLSSLKKRCSIGIHSDGKFLPEWRAILLLPEDLRFDRGGGDDQDRGLDPPGESGNEIRPRRRDGSEEGQVVPGLAEEGRCSRFHNHSLAKS